LNGVIDLILRLSSTNSIALLVNYVTVVVEDRPIVSVNIVSQFFSGGARPGPAGARAPAERACAPAVSRRQSASKLMELTRRLNDALQ